MSPSALASSAVALFPDPLRTALVAVADKLALSAIPAPVKWLFAAYLLANANGWPGVWHVRILWPFIKFGWQVKLGKKWPNDRVGKDEFTHQVEASTRKFRATPESCDAFGFHLSNSEYAITCDHIRGPFTIQLVGEFYSIPDATFALGATTFQYLKEIPFMAKYEIHNSLLGYDKKWLYILTTFRSPAHPKTGERKIYAHSISQLVMKHNRRTIPPARAFALSGYDSDHGKGRENWEIVEGMSAKEKLKWLVGEDKKGKGEGIVVGSEEREMDRRSEWPGVVVKGA
ncbi:hypothetical protein JCM8547_006370 [Rhodosporidiobolus lusitaniae]